MHKIQDDDDRDTCKRKVARKAANEKIMVWGADQTSWAAEISALQLAIKAKARTNPKTRKARMNIAIDCLNIHEQICTLLEARNDNRICPPLPKFGFGRWRDIWDDLVEIPIDVIYSYWIPSHGKKKDWKPPDIGFGNSSVWRSLNDIADVEAKDAVKQQDWRYGNKLYEDAKRAAITNAGFRLRAVEIGATHRFTNHVYHNEMASWLRPGNPGLPM